MGRHETPGETVNRFLDAFLHGTMANKEELLAGIEAIKPHIPSDLLEIILVYGALKNSGESETLLLDGIEVQIDKSIAGIILDLTAAGYRTVSSCSGVRAEHPTNSPYVVDGGSLGIYREEESLRRIRSLEGELHSLGVTINYDGSAYFEPAIILDFFGETDDILKEKWGVLAALLLESANPAYNPNRKKNVKGYST